MSELCDNFSAKCPNQCSSEIFPNIKFHLNYQCSENESLKQNTDDLLGNSNVETNLKSEFINELIEKN